MIEALMEDLQIERGRSIKTNEAYRHNIERSLEFDGIDYTLDTIRPALVRNNR